MQYISTRGSDKPLSFLETTLTGLARDGGLFLPQEIPDVRQKLSAWSRLDYKTLAFEIMRLYASDLPEDRLRAIIARSYTPFRTPEITPVTKAGQFYVLELFLGPTLAFKDVALQFLGNLFDYQLQTMGRELNIVVATSGDTGSAAIHSVRGRKSMRIFVMHPHGRVSPAQARQMTTVMDENVHNLAVDGTFDDCQNIVKTLFNDLTFRDRYHLGAVNSINWARVLAQIVYYFYAAFRVQESTGAEQIRFSVPTGNFGDIFAGYIAWRMGLPINRLFLATNENDILARFFATGCYSKGTVHQTLSPSMDIQIASNFERYLYYRANCNPSQLRVWMQEFQNSGSLTIGDKTNTPAEDPVITAGRGDTNATLATIKKYWRDHQYLLDPHTAVGVYVAEQHFDPEIPTICLATAHPAKFGDAIMQATGRDDLAHHPILDAMMDAPTRLTRLPADSQAIGMFIAGQIEK